MHTWKPVAHLCRPLRMRLGDGDRDGRVTFLHGDFLTLASTIPAADLVTLDRVLCCYHELDPLLLTLRGAQPALLGGQLSPGSLVRPPAYSLGEPAQGTRRRRLFEPSFTRLREFTSRWLRPGCVRSASSAPGLGDRALHPGELGEAGRIDLMVRSGCRSELPPVRSVQKGGRSRPNPLKETL